MCDGQLVAEDNDDLPAELQGLQDLDPVSSPDPTMLVPTASMPEGPAARQTTPEAAKAMRSPVRRRLIQLEYTSRMLGNRDEASAIMQAIFDTTRGRNTVTQRADDEHHLI